MVIAACNAGIVGSFPTQNARTLDELENWIQQISANAKANPNAAPWAVNIFAHPTYARKQDDLAMIMKYQPPLVITALGSPRDVVEAIHSYGGMVFADVINPMFARKAAATGVDGLILVSSGAGGHTGPISPFVFIEEVREFCSGWLPSAGFFPVDGQSMRARLWGLI
jgi:nitronate monooxygenase